MTDTASTTGDASRCGGHGDDLRLLEDIIARKRGRRESAQVSRALLDRFGRIARVLRARRSELAGIRGYGPDIGAELRATGQLLRALARREFCDRPLLARPGALARYCRVLLAGETRERLHILFLDKAMRLIAEECLQVGTVDHVAVYPREIIATALGHGASALILTHNHPSGNPRPSAGDIEMTGQIMRVGAIFGLRIADHLIVGAAGEFSFRSNGLLAPDAGR